MKGRAVAIVATVALTITPFGSSKGAAFGTTVPPGNVATSDFYRVATTPAGGRVSFPGWPEIIDLERADDGTFLVQLARLDLGVESDAVARLNADGSLDTTFGAGGPTPGIIAADMAFYTGQLGMLPRGLVPRADGRFLLGHRMYHRDGTVDTTYGVQGVFGSLPNNMVAGPTVTIVRTSTDQVVIVQSNNPGIGGCAFGPIAANGFVLTYRIVAAPCPAVDTMQLADGDTLVVSMLPNNSANVSLFFLRPDGTLDPTRGNGTGIVTTTVASPDDVTGAGLTPDGQVLLSYLDSNLAYRVVRLALDGTVDAVFGTRATCCLGINSFFTSFTSLVVDNLGRVLLAMPRADLGSAQAFELLRLSTAGYPDQTFNPWGVRPSQLRARDMGVTTPGQASGLLALADGRLFVRFDGGIDEAGQPFGASIVVLEPAPPAGTPHVMTVASGGAAATQPAKRGFQFFAGP
jgi:uncharacterized delta-60 repeat protein